MNKFFTFTGLFIVIFLSCESNKNNAAESYYQIDLKVKNKLQENLLSNAHFHGVTGAVIDKVIDKRITSGFARNEIITEATRAFINQIDDSLYVLGKNRGLWQGEFWGKWMLSAIDAYHYTGNEQLKETIRKETYDLIATQREDGYIGTYENSDLVSGNVWNVWCRKYTLWGLLAAYELLGEEKILEAAKKHMDQLITEVGPGHTAIIETGNFVGLPSSSILTPLVKLYRLTGAQKYLNYAEYIVDNWESNPGHPPALVSKGLEGAPVHTWFPKAGKWTKAYEFISCVEGLVDLYQVTGREDFIQAAKNIYKAIQENERVITGGIGYHDKLAGAAFMPEGLNEPCDVIYWQRLSTKLLALTGEQHYADEIERLTYNTLFGAFSNSGDWGLRRMGLNEPHYVAPLHCFTNHHQCCVANVPRGMLGLGQVALMPAAEANQLYINLYLPGEYKVPMANGEVLQLQINTSYPESSEVSVGFTNHEEVKATIFLRKPWWCQNASILLTGKKGEIKQDNWQLSGSFSKGTSLQIKFDMPFRLESLPGNDQFKAIMRGPVVFARSSMLEGDEIHQPLALNEPLQISELTPANDKIWMQYELLLASGQKVPLIDYTSTGKEYTKPSDPQATREMMNNRVTTDQRVWIKVKN